MILRYDPLREAIFSNSIGRFAPVVLGEFRSTHLNGNTVYRRKCFT